MLKNNRSWVPTECCTTKKNIIVFLAVFLVVFAFAMHSIGHAAGKVKAYGTLTAIEDDGAVIIDGYRYQVSPSAIVQNYRGDGIQLKDIIPPSTVHYEYEQTSYGFVIIKIKERAQ